MLLPVGQELGLVDGPAGRLAIALAAITMLIGPIGAKVLDGVLSRRAPPRPSNPSTR